MNDGNCLQVVGPLLGCTENGPVPGVGRGQAGRWVYMPHAQFSGIERQSPPLFALAQQAIGLVALGQVTGHGGVPGDVCACVLEF